MFAGHLPCYDNQMSEPRPIIYVVDDDVEILKSTKALLDIENWDVQCLELASDFLNVYEANRAGCLVLDLQMPEMNGLELQRTLSDWGKDIPIVFITGAGSVANSVSALKAGAADFIEKPFTRATLVGTIRRALKDQATARKEKDALAAGNKRFSELTEREWEVLTAMIAGPRILSSKEVARQLDISHRTVEHHRAHIMSKTQSRSLPELIRLASFIGIASPDLANND